MTDNVTRLPPRRDMAAEMKGPKQGGHSIIVDGRVMPHVVMMDRGEEIDFLVDGRVAFTFPREQAYNAAQFAFMAMAVAAGFASPAHHHFTQRVYAPGAICLGELPK